MCGGGQTWCGGSLLCYAECAPRVGAKRSHTSGVSLSVHEPKVKGPNKGCPIPTARCCLTPKPLSPLTPTPYPAPLPAPNAQRLPPPAARSHTRLITRSSHPGLYQGCPVSRRWPLTPRPPDTDL